MSTRVSGLRHSRHGDWDTYSVSQVSFEDEHPPFSIFFRDVDLLPRWGQKAQQGCQAPMRRGEQGTARGQDERRPRDQSEDARLPRPPAQPHSRAAGQTAHRDQFLQGLEESGEEADGQGLGWRAQSSPRPRERESPGPSKPPTATRAARGPDLAMPLPSPLAVSWESPSSQNPLTSLWCPPKAKEPAGPQAMDPAAAVQEGSDAEEAVLPSRVRASSFALARSPAPESCPEAAGG